MGIETLNNASQTLHGEVKARLYLSAPNEVVQFSYHLINEDRVLEAAFQDAKKKVEELTKLKVLV